MLKRFSKHIDNSADYLSETVKRLTLSADKSNIRSDIKRRVTLYRILHSQIKRNVAPRTACFRLYNEIVSENGEDRLTKAFAAWFQSMDEHGVSFSEALVGWVPDEEVMLIKASESSGQLADGIEQAMEAAKTISLIVNTAKSAAIMPLIMIAMAYGSVLMMANTLLPNIAGIVPFEDWPAASMPFKYFADFVSKYDILFSVLIVSSIIVSFGTLTIFHGVVRGRFDKVAPWSLHRAITSAQFLSSLSAMLERGIAPFQALIQLRQCVTPYLGWHIDAILETFQEEGDISAALVTSNLFEWETRLVIKTTADDSDFKSNIAMLANDTIEDVLKTVTSFAKIVQVVFLLTIGAFILWSLGSIGLVIFSFYQEFSSVSY